jgi:uncharacterized membrane protein
MAQYFSKDDLMDLRGIVKQFEIRTGCELVLRIVTDRVMSDEASKREYSRLGLGQTQGRPGMLLYVNLFQRRFTFLADRRIIKNVGDGWLGKYSDVLSDRFRKYQFGFGLHDVIGRMAIDLGETLKQVGTEGE